MNKVINSSNIRQQPFVIPDKVTLKDPALPFLSPICSFFDCDVQSSPGYLPLFLSSYSISLSILFLLSWCSNKGRDLLFIPSPTWGIAYPWRGIPQRHLGTLTASCRSRSVGTGQNYKRRLNSGLQQHMFSLLDSKITTVLQLLLSLLMTPYLWIPSVSLT